MGKEFESKDILVLRELDTEADAKYQNVLKVVKFGNYPPQLVNQQFYSKDGEWHHGKLKGFSKEDLEVIEENLDDIKEAMTENAKSDSKKKAKKK